MRINLPREGKEKIEIEPHDTWSLDHTLAKIIAPALKQLRATTHGSPVVYNEDVPKHLHSSTQDIDTFEIDEHWHERWNWVLGEMIWAFERIGSDEHWSEYSDEENDRINNGLRLFAKYYRGLWD